jgi:hypothetical protein
MSGFPPATMKTSPFCASKFFGQDTRGLVHTEIPLGHLDIGAVRSFGTVPDK